MNQPRGALTAGMEVTPSVRLLSPLGAGGMGAVWLADHAGLRTQVVVKFMLDGLDSSASARARFKREAEAASQVKSPHVVQTFDYGVTNEGVPFIVMEHLEGRDLAQELTAKGALGPATVITIIAQVSKALTKAHAAGLLHRDIKPDNIFLCREDGDDDLFVKLLDFGIAKAHRAEEKAISLDGETKTGQVVGTPFYMSPEQVTAQKVVDARSDLWSLGVVAFEALTGIRPFDGPSFGALAVKIATGEAPKPSEANPALPASLDEWFAKACARDAAKRFATARELADALRAAFEGVVSLPPLPAALNDSGSRGQSSPSHPGIAAASGEPGPLVPSVPPGPISVDEDAHQRPSFVLASTLDGAPGDRSSLARSEPGGASVAISEEARGLMGKRRVRGALVAGVVLAIVVAFAVGRSEKEPVASRMASTASAAVPAAAADNVALPTPKATVSPSAAASANELSNLPDASAAATAVVSAVGPSATRLRPTLSAHVANPGAAQVATTGARPPASSPTAPSPVDAGRHNDILY